jgi:glycosyltransferase involved in cell wall biosynthesis
MQATVAIVLKGYPRLSETFIAHEIRGLETLGLRIRLFSLRRPTDPSLHPVHNEIAAPVCYLPEYLHWQPLRVLKAWWRARRLAGYAMARAAFLADLKREPNRNRARRFGQALVLATALPPGVRWLHVHFLHTPASVVRYAALMTGLPWSGSAHAKDVWTTPEWDLRQKLAEMRWLVTCTAANAAFLRALAPSPERVALLYHGLDRQRFPSPPPRWPTADGSSPQQPVALLTVCRAVEKKGLDVLIEALAALPATLHWQLTHVGGGPLLPSLQRQARASGIAERIRWLGPQSQSVVLDSYRQADLFVLPCRIADDGDRDGLPNVLLEAQSQGLACVSTAISAIPELIIDGETGLLVAADDPAALSAAMETLIRCPARRQGLGEAGMRRVGQVFSFDDSLVTLMRRFCDAGAGPEPPRPCALPSMRR